MSRSARVTPAVELPGRPDTNSVDPAERPSDEQYRRFLTLVRYGVAAGWSQERLARRGAFRVLDPGFSAILSRACLDLAWLGDELGERRIAEESAAASATVAGALIGRADADGLVRPVDLVHGVTIGVTGVGSALALLAPTLPESRLQAARELVLAGPLASPSGIRSLARGAPRARSGTTGAVPCGPTPPGCARTRSRSTAMTVQPRCCACALLRVVGAGGMREYFEPEGGRGLGARAFAWTAALTLGVSGKRSSTPARRGRRAFPVV
jgi:mannosylglycerate hydrolase